MNSGFGFGALGGAVVILAILNLYNDARFSKFKEEYQTYRELAEGREERLLTEVNSIKMLVNTIEMRRVLEEGRAPSQ